MAARSKRSPSPLSSRPTNPNPRNSENQSTIRRSFNGNNPSPKPSTLVNSRKFDPITPENSPSDFARRRSVGKEGSSSYLKNCEEKENDEKDQILKHSKLQSPAKGSKNFMAPTISAASKFTPSPRKKPLVERNDPVRTSISLSDGKAMFFSNVSQDLEPNSEMGFNQNQKIPSSLDSKVSHSEKKESGQEGHPVSKPSSKKVTFLDVPIQDSQSANESFTSDALKMESNSKNNISCSPISTPIAPLDADPSMPPYDPKTNYLSPRPQFLYYKPNPRIEVLLNKEKGTDTDDFMPLEDDSFIKEFMSDNFPSDSEVTEDSEKEKLEAIDSEDMVIGLNLSEEEHDFHVSKDPEEDKLEAIASADKVKGLEENDDDDLIHVEKDEKKSCGITKMMCFSMVMMMLMAACVSVSVTRSLSFEEFRFTKDLSFSDLGNMYHQSRIVAAFEKFNLDRLARRINQFSVDCVYFVSKVANELGRGEATLCSVKYMNLSYMQMSTWDDDKGRFMNNNQVSEGLVVNVQNDDVLDEDLETKMAIFEEEKEACVESDDELDEDLETETDTFEEEEEACVENDDDSDESFEDEVNMQDDDVLETQEKIPIDSDYDYSKHTQSQGETINVLSISANELRADVSHDRESELEAEVEIIKSEVVEIKETNSNISPISDTTLSDQDILSDVNSLTENVQNPIIPESSSLSLKNKYLAHYYTIAISSFFAALLAFAGFTYHYKRNPNPSLANVVQDNNQKEYKMYQEKKAFSSQNWQREVDDVIGESSCPSEMSSFQKSAAYYDNNKTEVRGASEVQSVERTTRKYFSKRESLASSLSEFTTGSPSYGSFTTFEKIPIKNATGEEEIITPVRRSSRIRSHQITSP